MDEKSLGAYCRVADAIVPMHDDNCDWCGSNHYKAYEWDGQRWAAIVIVREPDRNDPDQYDRKDSSFTEDGK